MKKTNKKKAKKTSKPAAKKPVQKNALGTPYGDRVLVKPAAVEEKTSFGLIIPDSGKEKPETGIIVAVGEGKVTPDGKVVPVRVNVGDKVMFSKYGYDEVKINGAEYYLIREESITYIF